jgi:hypothetical protein
MSGNYNCKIIGKILVLCWTFCNYTLGLVIGHFDFFHIFRIRIPILFSLAYAIDRCR